MLIEQIYTDNAYQNFNYLVACPETGEALAIDPLEADLCLEAAVRRGWEIRQVLNTHEHWDHIGGNARVIERTGARLLAHAGAGGRIPGMDQGLNAGDVVRVGRTVELEVLDTPGHTRTHVCLLSHSDQPCLFCGDTLFNAGAGNCHNGGHPELLYTTFAEQLARLGDDTRIFPGHDYIVNNLNFTLSREPENLDALELLDRVEGQDPHAPLVTTLGMERQVNTFFRLQNPHVIEHLREQFPKLPAQPSPKEVFLKLRELRNHW